MFLRIQGYMTFSIDNPEEGLQQPSNPPPFEKYVWGKKTAPENY